MTNTQVPVYSVLQAERNEVCFREEDDDDVSISLSYIKYMLMRGGSIIHDIMHEHFNYIFYLVYIFKYVVIFWDTGLTLKLGRHYFTFKACSRSLFSRNGSIVAPPPPPPAGGPPAFLGGLVVAVTGGQGQGGQGPRSASQTDAQTVDLTLSG